MRAFPAVPLTLPYPTVMPDYEGRSIINLHHSLLQHFGVRPSKAVLESHQHVFDDARRVVVLCLDALGFLTVEKMLEREQLPFLQELVKQGHYEPLTTVFPSSTPIVLRSLNSGLSASELDLPGFAIYLKDQQLVFNTLHFQTMPADKRNKGQSLAEAGLDIETFYFETIFQKLSQQGVRSTVLFPYRIFNSELSHINQRGATRRQAYITPADMMLQLRECLVQQQKERHFISVYWDAIDVMQHVHGAGHEVVTAELATILYALEREIKQYPEAFEDTRLIIVSDHGHTQVAQHDFFAAHPALLKAAEMPFLGTVRMAYFRAIKGDVAGLEQALRDTFPEGYLVLPNQAFTDTGIFGGPVSEVFRSRMGDVTLIAPPGHAIWYSDEGAGSKVLGRHGGFTPEEMLIPLLSVRLDAL